MMLHQNLNGIIKEDITMILLIGKLNKTNFVEIIDASREENLLFDKFIGLEDWNSTESSTEDIIQKMSERIQFRHSEEFNTIIQDNKQIKYQKII